MLLSLLSMGPLGFASMPDKTPVGVCACGYSPLFASMADATAAGVEATMCHSLFGTNYYMPMSGSSHGSSDTNYACPAGMTDVTAGRVCEGEGGMCTEMDM